MDFEWDLKMYKTFEIPYTVLALLSIAVNSFLIHMLRKLKKLKAISFRFILLLTISDICLGITMVICVTLYNGLSTEYSFAVFKIHYILTFFIATVSFLMIYIIAVDRYMHMRFLTKYSTIMTNRRAIIMVVAAVLLAAICDALMICGRIFGFVLAAQLFTNCFLEINLITIGLLYIKAYREIRRRTDQMNLENPIQAATTLRRDPSKEFSRSVLFILSSLAICYTPYIICTTMRHSGFLNDPKLAALLEYTSLSFVFANSSLNAMIFLCFNSDLHGIARQYFKFHCLQNRNASLSHTRN